MDLDDPVTIAGEPADAETEALRELRALAWKKTGSIPTELVVRHVQAITASAEWPVKRAALEAVLRRIGAVKRDALKVAARPPRGNVLGFYRTRQAHATERPYRTLLLSLDPLAGSCDCADYRRSSLGACKHLFAILEDLAGNKIAARSLVQSSGTSEKAVAAIRLAWNPVRPLTGPGDWMERLSLCCDGAAPGLSRTALVSHFEKSGAYRPLKNTYADDLERRARTVARLQQMARRYAASGGPVCVEPAVMPLLSAEAGRLALHRQLRPVVGTLQRSLRTLKRTLYPYQLEGVRRFLSQGRLLLADDMGLGKTAQAIAAAHVLWHSGKVRRGLIIVPASLKSQWQREWSEFSDVPVCVVEGTADDRRKFYARKAGFLIANYEQVLRDLAIMHAWRPELVVLDEAQRIKNWATKTAASVKQLRPIYRLVLTGTPMENRLDELASLLDWVDDMALAPEWRLAPLHTRYTDGTREVAGVKNLDTLRARISTCSLRRLRKDVLKQLPSRTDTIMPIPLTEEQRNEHDAYNDKIARLVHASHQRPLSHEEFLRLMSYLTMQRIICNGMALAQFEEGSAELLQQRPTEAVLSRIATPKLNELRELVSRVALEQERRIVIFSQWRRMLELASWTVGDVLGRAHLRSVFFTGGESQKRRTQNIVDFHDDPRTRILFCTDAGGVGLNLQHAANCVINLELPWNPAVLEQRIGRIYRIGQKDPIEVYNLVANAGIEARIVDLVGNKRALFTGLFDGTSDEVTFERSGTFMSRIERVIEKPAVTDLGAAEESLSEESTLADEAVADFSDAEAKEPAARLTTTAPAALVSAVEAPAAASATALPPAAELAQLFAKLEVQRAHDGSLHIKAPPEAATALAAVFGGLAQMLSQAAGPQRD